MENQLDQTARDKLKEKAREARERAYVPYSHFPVGAAVLTASGSIYTGANIENASYPLSICAERTAIFQAITAGEREIIALAVTADTARPVSPCGACRQVMNEFNPEMDVMMLNLAGAELSRTAGELLPEHFTAGDLEQS